MEETKNPHFITTIEEMKAEIIKTLSRLSEYQVQRKWSISRDTGIPVEVLTVLLKQLKSEGKVAISMIFDQDTGLADGSGYKMSDSDFNL